MQNSHKLVDANLKLARKIWGQLSELSIQRLTQLTLRHQVTISAGDLILLNGQWYITHSGLIRLASRKGCGGIHVSPVHEFCDLGIPRWVFKATVFRRSSSCKGFIGLGDADPQNVAVTVHGAEMRVAETRAVNRALRKAYGIGICSVEELGALTYEKQAPEIIRKLPPGSVRKNGSNGTGPRVRDSLCQIIRQHQLDGGLVKAYATDFCGTKTLREAKREQVEAFVAHLADWAQKDRNALLFQLNSYTRSEPGAA